MPEQNPDHISNPFSVEGYPLQVRHGELEVDFANRSMVMCGQPLKLPGKQREYYAFLSLYLRREEDIVSLEQMGADMIVYNEEFPEEARRLRGIASRAMRGLIRKMQEAMVSSGNYEDLEAAAREIETCYIRCKPGSGCKLLQLN